MYRDVSAQDQFFQVTVGGRTESVAGTSASSPVRCILSPACAKHRHSEQTVAGVFALLNDFRLASGKPTLGFVNPLLYSNASTGFNDIISGSNPGCGSTGNPRLTSAGVPLPCSVTYIIFPGFTAGIVWDPVSRSTCCLKASSTNYDW